MGGAPTGHPSAARRFGEQLYVALWQHARTGEQDAEVALSMLRCGIQPVAG